MKKTKKVLIFMFLLLTCILLVKIHAQDDGIEISKKVISDVTAVELEIPAKFELTIKNKNINPDFFEIFTLLDVMIYPGGPFLINGSSEKTFIINVNPKDNITGRRSLVFYIKSSTETKKSSFEITSLPIFKILDVQIQNVSLDDNKFSISIHNTKNADFGNVGIKVNNEFIKGEKNITLGPFAKEKIDFDINKEKLKSIRAGYYDPNITLIFSDGNKIKIDKRIYVNPITLINTTEEKNFILAFLIEKIIKRNEGNKKTFVTIEIKKDFLSRIFTTFDQEPLKIEPEGIGYRFIFEKDIEPGQSFIVTAKTNYNLAIIILIIVVIGFLTFYFLNKREIVIKKKTKYVKTKGGEFALKIELHIRSRKEVKNVRIIDFLPVLTKLYEKFGTMKPTKVQKRKLYWKFNEFKKGEERVISYIIYSKISFIGKITLPSARVIYETDGKTKFTKSNKVFVLSRKPIGEQ